MQNPFVRLLVRWAILALGVALAASLVRGISYDTTATLVVVAVLLALLNTFLKPLLVLFTLPLVIFTAGLGLWLINALLLYFVGRLVEGFHVAGFGSALLGALIISLTNLFLGGFTRSSRPRSRPEPPQGRRRDDVIDI